MTEREFIERTPGRRRTPQNDSAPRCVYCDIKTEQSQERWDKHLQDEKERREACGDTVEKMQEMIKNLVPWKFVYVLVGIAIVIFGWLYVDHFGLSNKVSYNTAIITGVKEDIKAINDKLDQSLKNQSDLMEQLRRKLQ